MTEHPWIKSYPPGVRWDADIPLIPVQQILEERNSTTKKRRSAQLNRELLTRR